MAAQSVGVSAALNLEGSQLQDCSSNSSSTAAAAANLFAAALQGSGFHRLKAVLRVAACFCWVVLHAWWAQGLLCSLQDTMLSAPIGACIIGARASGHLQAWHVGSSVCGTESSLLVRSVGACMQYGSRNSRAV